MAGKRMLQHARTMMRLWISGRRLEQSAIAAMGEPGKEDCEGAQGEAGVKAAADRYRCTRRHHFLRTAHSPLDYQYITAKWRGSATLIY